MSKFKEDLKKVERLLKYDQIRGEYDDYKNLYDFLCINSTASKDEIKSAIGEKFEYYQPKQDVVGLELVAKTFLSSRRAIENILCDYQSEYDNHLIDLKVKELRKHFITRTRDQELDSKEKSELIEEGKEIGLSETQIIDIIEKWVKDGGVREVEFHSAGTAFPETYYEILGVSEDAGYAEIRKVYKEEERKYTNASASKRKEARSRYDKVLDAWECLRDNTKRRKYDEEQRRKRDKDLTSAGDPKLEIEDENGNERRSFEFKDMRLGATQSVTVIAKNGGGGTLDAKIKTSHPWLIVDTNKIHQSKLPQYITITVDPKKNPKKNTFGGKDTGVIKINEKKGCIYEINISYEIEEDAEDLKRFRQRVTIGGLVLGFIFGSQIYNIIEGTSYKITAEYAFLIALIVIVIVGSKLGYKDSGGGGAFGWGCGTFVGGLIILLILQSWFPHTFSTVLWSLIYGSIANISSDFMRPAIRQGNYQVPIGIGVGVLVLTVMLIIIGTEGARKKRDVELARSEARQNIYQTISKKITGNWDGYVGNKQAKLTIHSNRKGYIIYDNIKEYVSLSKYDLAKDEFVLKGTDHERLTRGKGGFSLDTFNGKLSEDGRSISGNYVDTAGNKGNWSVTKHVYTYKTPPKRYSSLILGRWKIESGVCEYLNNGKFSHTSNSGEKTQGKWNIEGNALTIKYFHPTQRSRTSIYKILEISHSAYKIVGISGNKGTYNAIKITSNNSTDSSTVGICQVADCMYGKYRDGKCYNHWSKTWKKMENPNNQEEKVTQEQAIFKKIDREAERQTKTHLSRQKKIKPSLNLNSLFASRNSRIYHKSNCPEILNTEDLIEFTSPQKARKAGGIPCKYCNPSIVNESAGNWKALSKERKSQPSVSSNITRVKSRSSRGSHNTAYSNPKVLMETSKGNITIELYEKEAPITVKNFLSYVSEGFYNNLIFHRVISNFMIQGGGFDSEMNQKPVKAPIRNEARRGLNNKRGTLAMARTNIINSATAQFFINLVNNDFLNHKDNTSKGFGYAVFGEVIDGMDVVDTIGKTRTHAFGMFRDVPIDHITIKNVSIIE